MEFPRRVPSVKMRFKKENAVPTSDGAKSRPMSLALLEFFGRGCGRGGIFQQGILTRTDVLPHRAGGLVFSRNGFLVFTVSRVLGPPLSIRLAACLSVCLSVGLDNRGKAKPPLIEIPKKIKQQACTTAASTIQAALLYSCIQLSTEPHHTAQQQASHTSAYT